MEPNRTKRYTRQQSLALPALFVLGLLATMPLTGWIVRKQLRMQASVGAEWGATAQAWGAKDAPAADLSPQDQALKAVADRAPSDYDLQLAYVLARPLVGESIREQRQEALRELIARFPNQPAAYAHYLRFATQGAVQVRRDEEHLLTGSPVPNPTAAKPLATGEIEAFLRMAEAGERLEPDNLFFPMMQAAGRFALKQDEAGIAALHRAGRMSRYADYSMQEAQLSDRLYALAFGKQMSLQRGARFASVLLPHFAQMRGVARVGTYLANQAEESGDNQAGMALRRDLLHCGFQMRSHSTTLIGNMVGIAIAEIATSRPGGAPVLKKDTTLSDEQRTRQRREAFYAWVRKIERPEIAQWAQTELERGTEVKKAAQKGIDSPPWGTSYLVRTFGLWAGGLLLASNIVRLLLLGGVALVLLRFKGLKRNAKAALFACALLPILFYSPVTANMGSFASVFQGYSMSGESAGPGTWFAMGVLWLCAFAAPLTLLLSAGVQAAGRGAFLEHGLKAIARDFLSITLFLLAFYAAVCVATAQNEARMQQAQDRILVHEGRYYVEQAQKPWRDSAPPPAL